MELGSFHDYADVPNENDRAKGNTGTERENRLADIRERIASGYYDRPEVKNKLADILTLRPEIAGTAEALQPTRADKADPMHGVAEQGDEPI